MTPVEHSEFTARSQRDGSRLQVHLWGNADTKAKEALDAFVGEVDREASEVQAEMVVVDLRDLAFMNSSCLKALVTWLSAVQHRPPRQQYRIRFLQEPAAHWQARSLGALATFAPSLVEIE